MFSRWRLVLPAVAVAIVLATGFAVALTRGGDNPAAKSEKDSPERGAGLAVVQALRVDPNDSQLYAVTKLGLVSVPVQGPTIRLSEERRNLESIAVMAPGHFLASGHTGDARSTDQAEHVNLGLIESTDGGRTWKAISKEGEAHFHALEYAHGTLYAAEEASKSFMVTRDNGATWETRSPTAIDAFVVSPTDPDLILAVDDGGLMRSDNGGRSFTKIAPTPVLRALSWPAGSATVFAAGFDGAVYASTDAGATWTERGSVRGLNAGLAASDDKHVYVASGGAVYASADGGVTFAFRAGGSKTDTVLPAGVKAGPEGEAFYRPPADAPDGAKPGDLIWARPLTAPEGTEGFGIMYWSTNLQDKLVPVSGVLFAPTAKAQGRRNILAWAHGSFGLADQCSPSLGYFQGNGASLPVVSMATGSGAIFVASDYEGLGTPAEHPFMVNEVTGRNVLDSIRAAERFTGAGADANAVVMGHSEGAGAGLLAADMHADYAPELRLVGTIAVSPPSNMALLHTQLDGSEYFAYQLLLLRGYRAAYPEVAAAEGSLTAEGRAALAAVDTTCTEKLTDSYMRRNEADFGFGPVFESPAMRKALQDNEPAQVHTDVPIFIVHGEADGTLIPDNSRDLHKRYCTQGAPVIAKFYPGKGHLDVLNAALPEILPYVTNRLAGTPGVAVCN